MRRARLLSAGLAVVAAGCHVRARNELTRPVVLARIPHPEGAIARRPALAWTDAGRLRFVEPLECPTEERYRIDTAIETTTGPNLATVTIGVITAAVGGVMLTAGLFSDHHGSSPYTALGAGGVLVGLPLAIGPFVGTGVVAARQPDAAPLTRPGPSQPCGDRPLAARSATIDTGGLAIFGAVAADGSFEVSPFDWIDAYDPTAAQQLTATVAADGGARTITAVLDRATLADRARAFLAHAAFPAQIAPLTVVPVLVPGAATLRFDGDSLVIALPLRNDGGPASAVRGQLIATGQPAIDGRMLYIGQVARGAVIQPELRVPLAPGAADRLRGAIGELALELRDAYGTAPATAVRVRGAP
jgi:hypothetical protein